jgi:hypothetical protein
MDDRNCMALWIFPSVLWMLDQWGYPKSALSCAKDGLSARSSACQENIDVPPQEQFQPVVPRLLSGW